MAAIALSRTPGFSMVTLFGSEPLGWQSLVPGGQATALGCTASSRAERNLLGTRLDRAVNEADRAVLLLAEGAGCLAAAWWARLSPAAYVSKVKGAVFFRPDDRAAAVFASPKIRLPFPSIVLDDAAELSPELRALAESWGSGTDEAAGEGVLARAHRAVERFTAGVVERDIRAWQNRLS